MKKLFFILLGCIILFGGLNCRKEKMGKVNIRVFLYEAKDSMAISGLFVTIFQGKVAVATGRTDNSGRVSFSLPEGHYKAIANDGFDKPDYSNDKSLCYIDTARANGPNEFDIIEGSDISITAIMDDVANTPGRFAPGYLEATVTKSGQPCSNARVSLYASLDDALSGTNIIVKQNTGHNGTTFFDWHPGKYYLVAEWKDSQGKWYTSDTSKTKNQPPNTVANGPQPVTIGKLITTNLTTVVDLAR